MKTFLKIVATLIVLGMAAALIYAAYSVSKKQNTIPPNTFPDQTATSTDDGAASSTPGWTFATSSLNASGWKTYASPAGFSVKYPSNLVIGSGSSSVTFVLPKSAYFHWPLQDDAKITVTASSSCPEFIGGSENLSATTTFALNGRTFVRSENRGAAAGNLYTEIAYDTFGSGMCYRLSFFDHGANGAGLYVSDPSLISQYDAQHDADMKAALDLFNAMAQSFGVSH